jgi:hypothetical protein
MPDEPQLTVSLPPNDWNVILSALFELPMKFAAPVHSRLQAALVEAQRPPRPPGADAVPSAVEVPFRKRKSEGAE